MNISATHFRSLWVKWKYGILYLLAIPAFALIYSFFPYGFYQSTVVSEGIFKQTEDRFSGWLTEVLEKRLSSSSSPSMRSQSLSCHINDNAPIDLNIQHTNPFFRYGPQKSYISSVWANVTLYEKCHNGLQLQTLFNVNADILYGDNRKLHFIDFIPDYEFTDDTGYGKTFNLIETTSMKCDELKAYFPDLVFNNDKCAFVLNDDETQSFNFLLDQYDQSLKGHISEENQFIRMFYLSTVTITTLGYGDIVPIKNSTRFLVAFQSIFGLILMGLFLNSIVKANRTIE